MENLDDKIDMEIFMIIISVPVIALITFIILLEGINSVDRKHFRKVYYLLRERGVVATKGYRDGNFLYTIPSSEYRIWWWDDQGISVHNNIECVSCTFCQMSNNPAINYILFPFSTFWVERIRKEIVDRTG